MKRVVVLASERSTTRDTVAHALYIVTAPTIGKHTRELLKPSVRHAQFEQGLIVTVTKKQEMQEMLPYTWALVAPHHP